MSSLLMAASSANSRRAAGRRCTRSVGRWCTDTPRSGCHRPSRAAMGIKLAALCQAAAGGARKSGAAAGAGRRRQADTRRQSRGVRLNGTLRYETAERRALSTPTASLRSRWSAGHRVAGATAGLESRGHWAVESKNHQRRDKTLGEDACLARCGFAPANRATCNNIVLAVILHHRRCLQAQTTRLPRRPLYAAPESGLRGAAVSRLSRSRNPRPTIRRNSAPHT